MDGTWQHTTVLLNEAVDALVTKPDGTYVDATFGRGGHSRLILAQLDAQGVAMPGRHGEPPLCIETQRRRALEHL